MNDKQTVIEAETRMTEAQTMEAQKPEPPARAATFKAALKACLPVVFGYIPTGFAFGLMLGSMGHSLYLAGLMSLTMYAGAGQYLAVELFKENAGLLQIAVMTFLINSKHLFYGLSLLEDYKGLGLKKFYMILALTDETYALLTEPGSRRDDLDRHRFCLYVSVINHCAWLISGIFGAAAGAVLNFNTKGMEFAMTALFLVILTEQLRAYKTKLPFVIGTLSGVLSLALAGKGNMLLCGSVLSGACLLIFRKKVEDSDRCD